MRFFWRWIGIRVVFVRFSRQVLSWREGALQYFKRLYWFVGSRSKKLSKKKNIKRRECVPLREWATWRMATTMTAVTMAAEAAQNSRPLIFNSIVSYKHIECLFSLLFLPVLSIARAVALLLFVILWENQKTQTHFSHSNYTKQKTNRTNKQHVISVNTQLEK